MLSVEGRMEEGVFSHAWSDREGCHRGGTLSDRFLKDTEECSRQMADVGQRWKTGVTHEGNMFSEYCLFDLIHCRVEGVQSVCVQREAARVGVSAPPMRDIPLPQAPPRLALPLKATPQALLNVEENRVWGGMLELPAYRAAPAHS